jgi:hypothetical protein
MENLNDLLTGCDAAEHRLAKGFLLDACNEILGDLETHIRIEQGHANFAEGVCDIGFADFTLTAEVFENVLKFIGKSAKHGGPM